MDIAGFSISVPNAHPLVKNQSNYTTTCSGGNGVLLEVVELILKHQNKLNYIFEKMSKDRYGYSK